MWCLILSIHTKYNLLNVYFQGELPVKKQEEILNKIFKSVLSIQSLQSNRKQGLSFKENFKIQVFCLSFVSVKMDLECYYVI